ncbi:MAG: hypothetical protein H3Z50_01710 [archaeon]|nr:hypothetical protein [archaeon]MCP8305576.1 hypothetical protein [archaeon]
MSRPKRVKKIDLREDAHELIIGGKVFKCSDDFDKMHIFDKIPWRLIKDIPIGEIPDNVEIRPVKSVKGNVVYLVDIPIGQLDSLYRNGFTIEISEHPKYYRGYMPVEKWIKVIHKFAKNLGFDVGEIDIDENRVGFFASKQCDPNLNVSDALERALSPLAKNISELEGKIKALVDDMLQ